MSSFSFKEVTSNMFTSIPQISLIDIKIQSYSSTSTDFSNKAVIISNCTELSDALDKKASYIIVQSQSYIQSCPTINQNKAYGFEINSNNLVGKKLTIIPQLRSITNSRTIKIWSY